MKIAVFHYSQSGQARRVAEGIWKNVCETVVSKEILPQHSYSFPWSRREFFDVFPESRLGLPPSGIHPIDLSDVADADLVMVVGQSWFLSPSLPLQSFFADHDIRSYLRGRNVVFVNVCRNMWHQTLRQVRSYVEDVDAHLVGHIVLQDEAPNLISAFTVVRWLMHGRKEASRLLPAAGVAEADIRKASRFGDIIVDVLRNDDTCQLQSRLQEEGAVHYKPSVHFLENKGYRMFGMWARFVRKKGAFGDERRQGRLTLFYVYLVIALYVVSPFGQLLFWLASPLLKTKKFAQIKI